MKKRLTHSADESLGDTLLVIDMQNVYLEGQPWECHNMTQTSHNIQKLIEADVCDHIIFTRYIASTDPKGTWKNYNVTYADINENPWMNEIIDDLKPYTIEHPVYDKSTYSSYQSKEVATLCHKADHVLITGVVAECCILSTILNAIDSGDSIIYLYDGVSGLSSESEAMTKKIIDDFSPIHAQIMSIDEYIQMRQK